MEKSVYMLFQGKCYANQKIRVHFFDGFFLIEIHMMLSICFFSFAGFSCDENIAIEFG